MLDKIRAIVEHDIDMITSQPDLPIFIMQELAQNPQRLIDYAQKAGASPGKMMTSIDAQIRTATRAKQIRKIEGDQLLINIMSLSIYPFIAKPMIKAMNELDDDGFNRMMHKRKMEVTNFVIDALKP